MEPQILIPNAKRIQGLSEPWKISSARPNWLNPKKSATANESTADRENNEAEWTADNRGSKEHHGDISSSVFKSLTSLLPSGWRKASQPKEAKDGQTVV
jgi:hypothetical protein